MMVPIKYLELSCNVVVKLVLCVAIGEEKDFSWWVDTDARNHSDITRQTERGTANHFVSLYH